jgi:putative membrane protein
MVLAGWTLTSLALISPLCNLSVALFSARVGQHMLISIVAAPLIALGLPRRSIAPRELWTATAAFGVALWFWHSPAPYQATFTSTPIYWAMHISMFTAALWFWWTLLSERRNVWPALFASFLISLQMTLLGALLTFSPKPLFAAHLLTTAPWGFSPLEDQQIGGLIMWVPTGVVLMIYALAGFGRELARLHRPHATVGSR